MGDPFLLALICLIAMASPGPDFVLVTRNSLKYPMKQAMATAIGIVSGCLIHATYCILGLALVITQNIIIFSTIKYVGACYLIYIGFKGLISKKNDLEIIYKEKPTTNISVREAFTQGFLCNLLNPKLAVFLLSLFTQFISIDATLIQKTIVAAIFVGEAAIYWPLMVVFLQTSIVQKFFHRMGHVIDRVCGVMLISLGVRVATSKD